MRKVILIIAVLIFYSFEKEKALPEISDEFKLEFLNEILSDTTDLKILMSRKQLISNFGSGYMMPPILPRDPKNSEKTISLTKFIADTLHIMDTTFVNQQRINNAKLDLDRLADFGFRIFDLKQLVQKEVPYNLILKMADSLNAETAKYSFVKFSIPIFNKEKNLAYIMLAQGSEGKTLILERVGNRWRRKYELNNWVE